MRHLQMKVVLKLCISCYKLGWFLVKFWPILGQSWAEPSVEMAEPFGKQTDFHLLLLGYIAQVVYFVFGSADTYLFQNTHRMEICFLREIDGTRD